jgi:hypothetical protein
MECLNIRSAATQLLQKDYRCQIALLIPIYLKSTADADQAARRGLMLTAALMQVIIIVTCMKPSLTDFLVGISIFVEHASRASADTDVCTQSLNLLERLARKWIDKSCTERSPYGNPCAVAQEHVRKQCRADSDLSSCAGAHACLLSWSGQSQSISSSMLSIHLQRG